MGRTRARQHHFHSSDLFLDFFGRSVRLAEQYRGGIEIVSGMHELLHCVRGRPIHHFKTCWNNARTDNLGYRIARLFNLGKRRHDHPRRLGLGHQLHGRFHRHSQHAFRPDRKRKQVVTRRIERLGTELYGLARDRVPADSKHIVYGQAVLEAVQSARILGDIATNRAGNLTRGIGCVI